MATKHYCYIAPPIDIKDPNNNLLCMTVPDVKGAITESISSKGSDEIYFFTDELKPGSVKRGGFEQMLGQIKKGDVVIMWSWQCLVNRNRLNAMMFDVLDALRKIHECGGSVQFVHEQLLTSKPVGRFVLHQLIGTAQYQYDLLQEIKVDQKPNPSSSCCSSPSSSVVCEVLYSGGPTGC